ncbi:aminotransferase class I/II-fold pyridoxal phosphate-dependent enzyme [Cohaesibacter gelatinilyticus]|uniref:Cystathionine beta-lyase/cystathionine gamma-synthase n=1 Tax=Cohaesibacter gelatinilyticus TaxID=372072 RepID=A0A285NC18_9HYPH|nr:aminotransferase class I/II-fold pyridoxal phosphate-dependent enzyme [Cohaesibacter gelatinilyticus]SNZ05221.1 Cystathionine beta-lyase/cystathionine gamma-synthase [Cohaesibacter gelatinilyticus]
MKIDKHISGEGASLATLLAAAYEDGSGSITPPIYQTSLFSFDSFQAFEETMAGRRQQDLYTRVTNPTIHVFEDMMAKAEGGEEAVAFSSGMAAISSTLFAFLRPGDRVACVENVYPDAYRLFEKILRPFGVEVTYHAVSDFEDKPDLLKGCRIAYLESPNSMLLQAMDLAKVAAHARLHDVVTVIDNSWATPVFQNPLAHGIDIVLHSASKYISGHSDVVAGVVVSSHDKIKAIRELTLPLFGGKLAPFEAWLLIRGLRSLHARMKQHEATANLFIERLSAHPAVKTVCSPAPNSVPGLRGRSGLMTIDFSPSVGIEGLVDELKYFKLGVSWGGFESLVMPSKVGLAQKGEQNSLQRFEVPDTMVRVSVGLEDAEDLWRDFATALQASLD